MNSNSQIHTFHVRTDVDWFVMSSLTSGWWYNVSTSKLVGGADTIMILYDQNMTIVKSSDDIDPTKCQTQPEFCASSISWKATSSGPYYLSVRTLTWPDQRYPSCPCPGYNITGTTLRNYLPIIIGPVSSVPTPTPTPTATATPTPVLPPVPTTIPGLSHPKGVAINPNTHMVYVTSRDDNRLYMIDGITLKVIKSVKTGREPWGVAVSTVTNKVYVGNFASNDVWVFDGATLDVLPPSPISVGRNPVTVKIDENRKRVYVTTYGSDAVAIIDTNTDEYAGSKPLGPGVWGLAVNSNLNFAYVGSAT